MRIKSEDLKGFVNGMVETTMKEKLEQVGFSIEALNKLNLDEDLAMECYIVRRDILLRAEQENLSLKDMGDIIEESANGFIKNYLSDYLFTIDVTIDIRSPKCQLAKSHGGKNGSEASVVVLRL